MAFKKLLVGLAALACASAMAQATLGTITNVQGVVTATTGTSGAAVTNGTPIVNGMRLVTSSGSSFTLRMNSGCTVNVQSNNGVTVLQSMTCDQLAQAVRPVVVPAPAVAGGPNPLLFNGLIVLTGGALFVEFIRVATENLSPS